VILFANGIQLLVLCFQIPRVVDYTNRGCTAKQVFKSALKDVSSF